MDTRARSNGVRVAGGKALRVLLSFVLAIALTPAIPGLSLLGGGTEHLAYGAGGDGNLVAATVDADALQSQAAEESQATLQAAAEGTTYQQSDGYEPYSGWQVTPDPAGTSGGGTAVSSGCTAWELISPESLGVVTSDGSSYSFADGDVNVVVDTAKSKNMAKTDDGYTPGYFKNIILPTQNLDSNADGTVDANDSITFKFLTTSTGGAAMSNMTIYNNYSATAGTGGVVVSTSDQPQDWATAANVVWTGTYANTAVGANSVGANWQRAVTFTIPSLSLEGKGDTLYLALQDKLYMGNSSSRSNIVFQFSTSASSMWNGSAEKAAGVSGQGDAVVLRMVAPAASTLTRDLTATDYWLNTVADKAIYCNAEGDVELNILGCASGGNWQTADTWNSYTYGLYTEDPIANPEATAVADNKEIGGITISAGDDIWSDGAKFTIANLEKGRAYYLLIPAGFKVGNSNALVRPVVFKFAPSSDDIASAVVAPIKDQAYTGSDITPSPSVMVNGEMLEESVDYELAYENNVNVATTDDNAPTVVVTGKGKYADSTKEVKFNIVPANAEKAFEVSNIPNQHRTGSAIEPAFTVSFNGKALEQDADYTVAWANNIEVGTATLTLTGKGNFTGEKTVEFAITNDVAQIGDTSYASVADAIAAAGEGDSITLLCEAAEDLTVAAGKDVKLDLNGQILSATTAGRAAIENSGKLAIADTSETATGTLSGSIEGAAESTLSLQGGLFTQNVAKGYAGTVSFAKGKLLEQRADGLFALANSVASADVTVAAVADQLYTGAAIEPELTVTFGATALENGKDYTVTYANNVNVGDATATLAGMGDWAGTREVSFKVAAANIANATIEAIPNQAFTGEAIEPALTVTYGEGETAKTLTAGTDYTLRFDNNTDKGVAQATIEGTGNYTGTNSTTFKIVPDLKEATIAAIADQTWNGEPLEPALNVTLDGVSLVQGVDYTVEYGNNVSQGTASARVTGIGDYAGSNEATFSIVLPVTFSWNVGYPNLEDAVATYDHGTLTVRPAEGVESTWALYYLMPTTVRPYAEFKDAIQKVIVAEGITTIGSYCFQGFGALTDATLSDTVRSTGNYVFSNCPNLSHVDMGGTRMLTLYCFQNCTSLEGIVLSDNVTRIQTSCFDGCSNLKYVIGGAGLTNMEEAPFNACYNIVAYDFSKRDMRSAAGPGLGQPTQNYTQYVNATVYVNSGTMPWSSSYVNWRNERACLALLRGGSVDVTQAVAGELLEPSKAGYVFDGWYADSALTVAADGWEAGAYRYAKYKSITVSSISAIDAQLFTGSAIEPTDIKVYDADGIELVSGQDYNLEFANNTDVGVATVTAIGAGAYEGSSAKQEFRITNSLESATVSTMPATATFTGRPVEPEVSATIGETQLVNGTDYTVEYSDNVEVGMAEATITGTNTYSGTAKGSFEIVQADIAEATIAAIPAQPFAGTPIAPRLSITFNGTNLVEGVDYTVSWSDNTNPGTAKGVVIGKGNFTGETYVSFAITPSISETTIEVGQAESLVYTGSAIEPAVTVSYGTTTLIEGTDYKCFYSDNVNAGIAGVIVVGIGSWSGLKAATFEIKKASISDAVIADIEPQTYTGAALEPDIEATFNGIKLQAGTDYTMTYANNVNIPANSWTTPTVTVQGAGDFQGSVNLTFGIVLPDTMSWEVGYPNASDVIATYSDGELRIALADGTNSSAMMDFASISSAPWYGSFRSNIASVVVEDGVSSIGNNAFSNLTLLTDVHIGTDVERIGNAAFYNAALQTLVLGPSVVSIGTNAFFSCQGLQRVQSGSGLSEIGATAFGLCMAMNVMDLSTSSLENVSGGNALGTSAQMNRYANRTIYVKDKASAEQIQAGAYSVVANKFCIAVVNGGDVGDLADLPTDALSNAVVKDGYRFTGWYEDEQCTTEATWRPGTICYAGYVGDTMELAIDSAQAALSSASISPDGSDVATGDKWVAQEAADALQAAIDAAQGVADDPDATPEAIAGAKDALYEAIDTFTAAMRDGLMTVWQVGAPNAADVLACYYDGALTFKLAEGVDASDTVDFARQADRPWASVAADITSVAFEKGVVPDNLDMYFYGCTSLAAAPLIPATVESMRQTFWNDTALTQLPEGFSLPEGADLTWTFGIYDPTGEINAENLVVTYCSPLDYPGLAAAYTWTDASSYQLRTLAAHSEKAYRQTDGYEPYQGWQDAPWEEATDPFYGSSGGTTRKGFPAWSLSDPLSIGVTAYAGGAVATGDDVKVLTDVNKTNTATAGTYADPYYYYNVVLPTYDAAADNTFTFSYVGAGGVNLSYTYDGNGGIAIVTDPDPATWNGEGVVVWQGNAGNTTVTNTNANWWKNITVSVPAGTLQAGKTYYLVVKNGTAGQWARIWANIVFEFSTDTSLAQSWDGDLAAAAYGREQGNGGTKLGLMAPSPATAKVNLTELDARWHNVLGAPIELSGSNDDEAAIRLHADGSGSNWQLLSNWIAQAGKLNVYDSLDEGALPVASYADGTLEFQLANPERDFPTLDGVDVVASGLESGATYYLVVDSAFQPQTTAPIGKQVVFEFTTENDVDVSALRDAIETALQAPEGVSASEDGKDLASGTPWATQEAVDTIQDAVSAAQATLADRSATQDAVDQAVASLAAATQEFAGAVQVATVDKSGLSAAVASALDKLANATVSSDGIGLAPDAEWVTQEDYNALNGAVVDALLATLDAGTQGEVDEALASLNDAVAKFDAAAKTGAAVNLAKAQVQPIDAHVYTGSAIEPAIVVTIGGVQLVAGTDYEVAYENNVNVGLATATITGIGASSGTATVQFAINKADVSGLSIEPIDAQAYTGGAIEPAIVVSGDQAAGALVAGTDYSVSYLNNVDEGTATVIVALKGNYEGMLTSTFQIVKNQWTRLAGDTRYKTMSAIVSEGFESSSWAIVATGETFPDALAASALAGSLKCPVVLTGKASLSDQAAEQLERLGVSNVYIMGGTSAVSDDVEQAIAGMGIGAERLSGADRMATSIEAMKKVAGKSDTVIVSAGYSFADALSIGPWSYATQSPIVLAGKDGKLTADEIAAISAAGYRKYVVVGGEKVVSPEVDAQLAGLENLGRLAGDTRYATSQAIAEWEIAQGMSCELPAVATGQNFPDALAGAALAGSTNSVMVLVKDEASAGIETLAANKRAIEHGYVLGGASAVPDDLAAYIAEQTDMVYSG